MRNIIDIADEIIKVIDEKCDFNEEKVVSIIEEIERIKKDSLYRAPELAYMDWDNLAGVLSQNFVPQNSRWETEIMVIFNNLSSTVDDYYQNGSDVSVKD